MNLFSTTQNKVLTLSCMCALEIPNCGKLSKCCLYFPMVSRVERGFSDNKDILSNNARRNLNLLSDGIQWYQESRWSYRRLCNNGTSGILQACTRKIPDLLKSEKENRRGQSENTKKEVQEELQTSRKKKERLEKMVQELTKEADELSTQAETKHKKDLLVKSNAMRPKTREKGKKIENEEKNIDGLQKKLMLM